MYRADGPEEMRPVGEVAFANGAAAMSASGGYGPAAICAGIVGHANLLLGDRVKAVLEAEIAAGQGRFRGIRHSSAWDADADGRRHVRDAAAGTVARYDLPQGFCLSGAARPEFDAWLFHPQLGDFIDLARAFPTADHPRSLRRPARHRPLCRQARGNLSRPGKPSIQEIAKCPNVVREARRAGDAAARLDFHDAHAADSEQLAAAWRPYIETCIEAFGPERACSKAIFRRTRASAAIR